MSGFPNRVGRFDTYSGLAINSLFFFYEAKKSNLLNGLAVSWLAFQTELRELIDRFGLAMGLLAFLSEAEKSILINGLAVGGLWAGWFSK